jgi:hypothetical protein
VESEGAIRATKGGNAPGAKGPCFSDAFSRGRHGVIADEAQHTRGEGVRVLQRKLYRAAKERRSIVRVFRTPPGERGRKAG